MAGRPARIAYGAVLSFAALVSCGGPGKPPARPLPPLDTPLTTSGQNSEYRLQRGDVLRVKFPYHPEMDIKLPIRADGRITLQPAGEIMAAGLTADELAAVVRERSSDVLREPEVTVIVAEMADKKVYVAGEVKEPGFVRYRQGLTPLQAVLDRGGFTDTARADSVIYVMASGDGDKYEATRLDLVAALRGEGETIQLAENDVLYVPRSFVGDVVTFVDLYIRRVLPFPPRVGFAP